MVIALKIVVRFNRWDKNPCKNLESFRAKVDEFDTIGIPYILLRVLSK